MRCLDDRALLELREDDPSPAAREHVASCARCASRAASLERDLALVTRVLREAPLPPIPARSPALAWLVPATALAALALFLVPRLLSAPAIPPETRTAAAARPAPRLTSEEHRLREVSRALFALDPLDPVVRLRRENELGLVEAAISGQHPCERGRAGCEW